MVVKYSIGIDEVGRGPLAGPVTLCAVMVEKGAAKNFSEIFRGVRDSKQLTEKVREKWSKIAKSEKEKGAIQFSISSVQNFTIDKIGLARAVRRALKNCLKKLEVIPSECEIFLDGSLYAPKEFKNQKTIIGGDSKVKIISLASVIAKVHRDRKMARLSKKYPGYGFEIHKGYGTKLHYKSLKKWGVSEIHRKSFLHSLPTASPQVIHS
ncbi:MAG: ribonuclease HII [Candidatus Pacebacteria bacterium]|nr:ribonuclease HII [Candidatus Paceibacterota bacterium]MDD5356625.1 ribonuclease HII [Candidatus Paceibacterota bacterium]